MAKNGNIDLSIIILNYNGQCWLSKLLPSLKENYLQITRYSVEVVIVDNCSTDGSASFVSSFDWVRLIESGYNGGFAYGNNIALKNNEARYVMLLNSDTEFSEDVSNLDRLIEYLDKYEEAGIITPKIELSNGCMDLACHRGEPTPWASFVYFMGLEKLFPESRFFAQYHQGYKNLNEIHEIDACTGAAMIVRNSAMKKVGLLDERFFIYAEDVDWCKRFRESGYKVVFDPEVRIIHHKFKSGIQNAELKIASETQAYFYRTMLQYYDKHYREKYPRLVRSFVKFVIEFKIKHL